MKKLLLVAILALLPVLSFALPGSLTINQFSWTAPTTFADGTPATASDIAGYDFYWYLQSGSISDANKMNTTATTLKPSALPTLADGSYYAVVDAIDANGNEGLPSATYAFTVKNGVVTSIKKLLNPPTGLTSQ